MSVPLTVPQSRVLAFVRDFVQEAGYPPTRAEIAAHMKFASPNSAECVLRALHSKGAIELRRGTARGIRVL